MSIDITGMKFGKLTVVRKTDKKPKGRFLWECKCDCGNIIFIPSNSIKTGNTKSCGCLIYEDSLEIDLKGKSFGKLYVIERDELPSKWRCRCSCGNDTVVYGKSLLSGGVKSCGCLNTEQVIKRNKSSATHKMSYSRLYGIWAKMKTRCTCETNKDYKNYGGRGIGYCHEWEIFDTFNEWALSNGYEEHLTLERIDVNGNYEPSNCKWLESSEQANNKTTSRYITANGKSMTIAQWAREIGISRQGLRYRLEAGWKIEDLVTPSDQGRTRLGSVYGSRRKRMLTINGVTKPMLDWADEIGISYRELNSRISNGLTEDELLLRPEEVESY